MAALGFRRKEILEERDKLRIRMNAPFAFTLGKDFKTNKARLVELSEVGMEIRIPVEYDIPDLNYFMDIPMAFRLPGDKSTWNCQVEIERIYAYDERDNHVYGMEVQFKSLTKEQNIKMKEYIKTRKNVSQMPHAQGKRPGPAAPRAS